MAKKCEQKGTLAGDVTDGLRARAPASAVVFDGRRCMAEASVDIRDGVLSEFGASAEDWWLLAAAFDARRTD